MRRVDSFENTLMLGKIEGRRRREQQRMRWLDDITDTMDMGLGGLQELVINREAWRTAVHGVAKNWTRLRNWTEVRGHVNIMYSRIWSHEKDSFPKLYKQNLIQRKHQREILQCNKCPTQWISSKAIKSWERLRNDYRQDTKKTWWPSAEEYTESGCGTDKKY